MSELPPLRIREADGSPNIIPVFDLILSNNLGIVQRGGGVAALTVTTGGGGSSTVYAATANSYIVLNTATDLTGEFRLAQSGNSITISTADNVVIINAVTNSGGVKTVRLPMSLWTVQVNSGNSFWTAKSGTNLDQSYVAYADSGAGLATFWTHVPTNLAATPAWGVDLYHSAEVGNGGNIILFLNARVASNGATVDSTTTNLVNGGTFLVNTVGVLTVSTMTATNFDSTLAISATHLIFMTVRRLASNAGDTVNAQWNLHSASLRTDVT